LLLVFLGPSNVLFKHMDKLCQVFDKVLMLDLKDEYEMASNALESLLYNIVHMRPLQNYYTGMLGRVSKVVADHDKLLTQFVFIEEYQCRSTIFIIDIF
jgi:hypothetical protein